MTDRATRCSGYIQSRGGWVRCNATTSTRRPDETWQFGRFGWYCPDHHQTKEKP